MMTTKTCFYYFIIEPVREKLKDDGQNVGFEIPFEGQPIKVSLITYDDGQPMALRFEITSLKEERIPDSQLDIIHSAKEHFLSTLQVTYESNARYAEPAIWNFVDDGSDPTLNISWILNFRSPTLDTIKNIFISTMPHRSHLQLLANGSDPHLPLPLRYLSLYKLIEHRYKTNGHWKKEELTALLEPFRENWKSKGLIKNPYNIIHDIRDRCAHARMNSDKLGILSVRRQDSMEISSLLPDMMTLGRKIVQELSGGKIRFDK